ncbi:MAG: DUF2304 domain-containing protein [Xanthomonadales bacterium]|jgi:hypothetical protein|nr:DUF2304 domain-containing protein [Xanthomonadales bacterium]
MFATVSGLIGIAAALTIIVLIRRDHLHVRYGLWWLAVAAVFVVLGFFPTLIDWLAAKVGVAYGPVLALTLGLTVFAIKVLTLDIARSRDETRTVRLIQRIAMLESEVRHLEARLDGEQAGSKENAESAAPAESRPGS